MMQSDCGHCAALHERMRGVHVAQAWLKPPSGTANCTKPPVGDLCVTMHTRLSWLRCGRHSRRLSARSGFPASPVSSIITELPGEFKTESGAKLHNVDVVWEQWGDATLPPEQTVRRVGRGTSNH